MKLDRTFHEINDILNALYEGHWTTLPQVQALIDALGTSINENLTVDDPAYNTRQKMVNEIRSNDVDIADLYNIKANKADVVNNLTTDDASKIASANTAFLLKNLVDGILDNLSVDDPTYDTRQKLLNFLKSNKALITALQADKINFTDIADNLTTNDPAKVASANTVVILKGMIDNINTILASDDLDLNEFQEFVDFIKQNREDLNALTIPNIAGLQDALDSKVDKISGKGLSANDLTNTLLTNYNFAHAFASTFSIADYHAALDGRYLKIEDTPTSGTVGEVVFYAGATPNGVTIADGRAVNRLGAYADLFAAIGTDYGQGDGVTTFNLPSWSGRSLSPDGAASSDKLVYTGNYQSVALVANAELVLSGEQTIGGVNYTEDQLIYARNQSTISERKIYQVKTGAWVALAAVDYDGLFIVGSGSVFKTEGGGYVTSDFDILNSIPSDSRAIVSYPDADVIQIEITNHLGAFHAGIRFSVVGNSNQGLLSPNEVLGTDVNGDISVLGLGSNLQLVASVLSVKAGIFEPVFAKKEGFNNDYGTAAGTVAQGNDSRIVNGQTAYGFTSTFSIENYHDALDGRYLQSHPDTSNQDTVLLNGAAVLSSLVLDEYGHITSITTRNLLPPNIGAEPAIGAKGTAFNKNFGTTADTVSQGNDSRIVNGQTAYNWGNWNTALYSGLDHDNPNEIATAKAIYDLKAWVEGQITNMAKTNVNNNFSVGQTVNGDFQVTGLTLLDAGLGVGGSVNVTGDVTASNFKRPV